MLAIALVRAVFSLLRFHSRTKEKREGGKEKKGKYGSEKMKSAKKETDNDISY